MDARNVRNLVIANPAAPLAAPSRLIAMPTPDPLPPDPRLFPTALSRPALLVGVILLGGSALGCQNKPPLRITHAPTYSYMHDADARAEVELWPDVPTAAGYDVISISERK